MLLGIIFQAKKKKFNSLVLKFRLGCVPSSTEDEGNTHEANWGQSRCRQSSVSAVSCRRHLFTCLVRELQLLLSLCQPSWLPPVLLPISVDGRTDNMRGCCLKNKEECKSGRGVWKILDGILVTLGELLSSLNPPPLWTHFPPSSRAHSPCTGRMQCQEGEHWAAIVCANQSGMPGWQKGEEWAQGTQSQGEEKGRRRRRWEEERGQSAGG